MDTQSVITRTITVAKGRFAPGHLGELTQHLPFEMSTVIDLVGTIGRHVLADLLPARRLRVSPRIVKRAISKYQARGPIIDRTSYKATVSIDILTPADP